MANQPAFKVTNPFSNNQQNPPKAPLVRRGSIARAAPKAPSAPPKIPNGSNQLRQQIWKYENMYKQTKNQLEVLKMQYRTQEKELGTFKSQKQLIETSHSNIISWQRKIAQLEMQRNNLMDKNGLFLQQKNEYLLELSDVQQKNDEYRIEMECKTAEIEKLETEITNSSQNYTQQLSKKENKYKNLKDEYNSLNQEYMEIKQRNRSITQERNRMTSQLKQITQEHTLMKDTHDKLQHQHNVLTTEHQQLQTQISQVHLQSTIAVRLAQKKDKNTIKDLRQTLKSETMKAQQYRAEYMQLKDEVNDLREWRENYLKQQTLQQRQPNRSKSVSEIRIPEDLNDNTSTASSTSNHTASSKNSRNSKNSITIKNKLKIIKQKSVNAIYSNVTIPSFQDLLPTEFQDHDDEKMKENNRNDMSQSSTKEHDEVIGALSDRLAIVKENYMNLKQVVVKKDNDMEKLKYELDKNKEMITDLIEKVNAKPLPPTPTEMAHLEHTDERKEIETVIPGVSRIIHRPPNRPPPMIPPPNRPRAPLISPSYNKGIQHDLMVLGNQLKKVMDPKYNNSDTAKANDDDEDEDVNLGDGI